MEDDQIEALVGRLSDPAHVSLVEKLHQQKLFRYDTIGCLLPLTGQYKVFGQRALRGIELALHQYGDRRNGGPSFKIILKDTKSDPDVAAQRVEDLFEEKVACIIGPVAEPLQAVKKAQKLGIPIIALSQKEGIPETGDYVFRNFITPKMQVSSLVSYAVNLLGENRFAVLYPLENYGKTYLELFREEVLHQNAEMTGVASYEPGQTDFEIPIKQLLGLYIVTPEDPEPALDDLPNAPIVFIPDAPKMAGLIIPNCHITMWKMLCFSVRIYGIRKN